VETDGLVERTERVLEWERLLSHLAEHCASESGAARLLERRPAEDIEEARVRNRRLAQAIALDETSDLFEIRAFPALGDALERAKVGSQLSGTELRDVMRVLELAKSLRAFATARRETDPELAQALESDPLLDRLLDRLSKAIDPDGSVSDHASPALRDAREKARHAREELKQRLEESMRRLAPLLQGQYVTEREGRYVLPLRADAHQRVEGVVLGASGSGSTLFIEPREVTQYGNQLKIREAAVEREVAKVLEELTGELSTRADAVGVAFEACVEADTLQALTSFAARTQAHPFEPEPGAVLELTSMRHPLLLAAGQKVVSNDIRVRGGRALVVSGPNAGGKTVALKCLGLAAWMARAGLPVPADPASKIGWFGSVLADVGDEQSLSRNLSTFSAHLVTIAEILSRSGPDTLVLLDELAAGTDPEEGAALAGSILEALTERGAAVVVTTHYERLKEMAAEGERAFDNASVGFDFEAMAPTFKLLLGVPGPSSALAVARRFGLSERVVARAKELLPAHAVSREEVVRKLEQERAFLEKERASLRGELALQQALREELEAARAAEERETENELARESRELVALVQRAREEVRDARRRLKETNDANELRELERQVNRAAAHVAIGGTLARRASARSAGITAASLSESLVPGMSVRLKNGALAVVEAAPERGHVRLRAGSMKLSLSVNEIESVQGRQKPASAPAPRQKSRLPPSLAAAVRTADNTLDLRGERLEDALARVDAFLDQMLGEGHAVGFVLHGHGTGTLKSAVREHLGASRYVENARPAERDEGGDAYTVFWIAD
jgi:DNA mismatch repair protein MutS2